MCFPFLDSVVSLHKEGVSVAEPLYISFDAPIFKLPSSLDKVVVHGRWPQENSFKPWWEWFNELWCSKGLSVYLEDVGRRNWAIIIAEAHDSPFIEEFDPFDGLMQSHADVDFES